MDQSADCTDVEAATAGCEDVTAESCRTNPAHYENCPCACSARATCTGLPAPIDVVANSSDLTTSVDVVATSSEPTTSVDVIATSADLTISIRVPSVGAVNNVNGGTPARTKTVELETTAINGDGSDGASSGASVHERQVIVLAVWLALATRVLAC